MGTTSSNDDLSEIIVSETTTDIYVSVERMYSIPMYDIDEPSYNCGNYEFSIFDFAETTITADAVGSGIGRKVLYISDDPNNADSSTYTFTQGATPPSSLYVKVNVTVNMVTTEGSYTMTVAYGEVLRGDAIVTAHNANIPRWSDAISVEFEGLSDTAIPEENSSGDDRITINSDGMTVYYSVKYSLPVEIVKRANTSVSESVNLTSHNSQSFVLDAHTICGVIRTDFNESKIDGTLYLGENDDDVTAPVPWTIDSEAEYERCNDGGGRHVVYAESN